MTNRTPKQQEEAQEIVDELDCRILEDFQPTLSYDVAEWLKQRLVDALAARDAQVREVLEGLRGQFGYQCWCDAEGDTPHLASCHAARALWEGLQVDV